MSIDRRQLLRGAAGAGAAVWLSNRVALAADKPRGRFVFIIQRGGADGLSTIIPTGDPAHRTLREQITPNLSGALKLDDTFTLHPSLVEIGRLYRAKQALFAHAVATSYRDRSHFDGQNVLETGATRPFERNRGWLNAVASLIQHSPQSTTSGAIAFAPTAPLALRGPRSVATYAASSLPAPTDDLMAQVQALYADDPQLQGLWGVAAASQMAAAQVGRGRDPASLGKLAATFLSNPDGPFIGMIETNGWDTHASQAPRLAGKLARLDALIAALREGLGPRWADTVILVATEFGRTAAANGTNGTDHGTASAAMLLGGAVKGGRVLADWPGLTPAALYQNRDLRPTSNLNALIASAVAGLYEQDPEQVYRTLFGTTGELPISDVVGRSPTSDFHAESAALNQS